MVHGSDSTTCIINEGTKAATTQRFNEKFQMPLGFSPYSNFTPNTFDNIKKFISLSRLIQYEGWAARTGRSITRRHLSSDVYGEDAAPTHKAKGMVQD